MIPFPEVRETILWSLLDLTSSPPLPLNPTFPATTPYAAEELIPLPKFPAQPDTGFLYFRGLILQIPPSWHKPSQQRAAPGNGTWRSQDLKGTAEMLQADVSHGISNWSWYFINLPYKIYPAEEMLPLNNIPGGLWSQKFISFRQVLNK